MSTFPPPTRPVLRYHGGKYRIADWVVSHFPAHRAYVEPFGGVASVLMAKPAAFVEVYNDLDDGVVNLFRILRNPIQAEDLRRRVELTPFSRAEFEFCWQVSEDPIEEARRMIVRSFQAIGNKDRLKRHGWRTRTAKSLRSPCVAWNGWPESIPDFTLRLRDTIIENLPWQRVVDVYDDPDTLLYLDPPYVLSTRTKSLQKVYAHEMDDAGHLELVNRLLTAESMVVLSGYDHPLYNEALRGWVRREKKARAQTNAPRLEVLWLNPAATAALHYAHPTLPWESEVAA